jgi:fructose-1,6-bisphosphatase I
MAYIMEKAGGRATDGENRILDIQPTHIHQRVPIHMGSAEDIQAGSYTRPLFSST